jgi:hypothetical protein
MQTAGEFSSPGMRVQMFRYNQVAPWQPIFPPIFHAIFGRPDLISQSEVMSWFGFQGSHSTETGLWFSLAPKTRQIHQKNIGVAIFNGTYPSLELILPYFDTEISMVKLQLYCKKHKMISHC